MHSLSRRASRDISGTTTRSALKASTDGRTSAPGSPLLNARRGDDNSGMRRSMTQRMSGVFRRGSSASGVEVKVDHSTFRHVDKDEVILTNPETGRTQTASGKTVVVANVNPVTGLVRGLDELVENPQLTAELKVLQELDELRSAMYSLKAKLRVYKYVDLRNVRLVGDERAEVERKVVFGLQKLDELERQIGDLQALATRDDFFGAEPAAPPPAASASPAVSEDGTPTIAAPPSDLEAKLAAARAKRAGELSDQVVQVMAKLTGLSSDQVREARKAFVEFDTRRKGEISRDGTKALVAKLMPDQLDEAATDSKVNEIFAKYDKDGSNSIDFEEFIDLYKDLKK